MGLAEDTGDFANHGTGAGNIHLLFQTDLAENAVAHTTAHDNKGVPVSVTLGKNHGFRGILKDGTPLCKRIPNVRFRTNPGGVDIAPVVAVNVDIHFHGSYFLQ